MTTDFTEGRRYGRPFSLVRHGVRSRYEVARHGSAVGAGVLTPFIAPEFFLVPLAGSVRSWFGSTFLFLSPSLVPKILGGCEPVSYLGTRLGSW